MRLSRPHPTLALLFLILAGCTNESLQDTGLPFSPALDASYRQDPDERERVYATLTAMQENAFRAAFSTLGQYDFTRRTTVAQLDVRHRELAATTRTVRSATRDGRRIHTTLEADTARSFDFGLLAPLASSTSEEPEATPLARYLLLEDPPYLSERNREAFSYRALPDTLFWDMPTQVLEIRTLPEAEDAYALRYVRLYLDRATGEIVGLYLERFEQTFLYGEASIVQAALQPAPDEGWLPHSVSVTVRLRMPLQPPRHFQAETTYSDYVPH